MLRTNAPIGAWLDQTATDPAGGALSVRVRRLNGDLTTVVPGNRRSISVARITGSPVVGGTVMNNAAPRLYRSDYPGWQLPPLTIDTLDGDDVLVVETWITAHELPDTDEPPPPPPPTHGDALMLEDGTGVILLEDGSGVLLLE